MTSSTSNHPQSPPSNSAPQGQSLGMWTWGSRHVFLREPMTQMYPHKSGSFEERKQGCETASYYYANTGRGEGHGSTFCWTCFAAKGDIHSGGEHLQTLWLPSGCWLLIVQGQSTNVLLSLIPFGPSWSTDYQALCGLGVDAWGTMTGPF